MPEAALRDRLRVLLASGDAALAGEVDQRLDRLGYAAAGPAVSGEAALDSLPRLSPDMVLVDLRPEGGLDGPAFAAAIRERFDPAILFLTARLDREILRQTAAAGAAGYVLYPLDDRQLCAALETARQYFRDSPRTSEDRAWMAAVLRKLPAGLLTTDPAGRVRYANAMAASLLGAGPDRLLGCELDAVYRVSRESPDASDGHEGRSLAVLHGFDGRDIPVEEIASPLLDDGGQRTGTVVVFRDISHHQRVERALRESVMSLRRTLAETVNALTVTSETRDPFTAGHQERVSRLACALAEILGLSAEEREGVRMAGLVHDIGKIHVPSEILAKPQVLSDMEMGIVRDHSAVGHEILKDIPFPWPVARMVLEHHERLDGSGYPAGLTGEATLLASRILAVADVVEAMNAHRPYRAALGLEKALEEIRVGRGVIYDSKVVDACLELFSSGDFRF